MHEGFLDFETLQRRLLQRVKSRVQNGEVTERGLARMIGISQPHMHHILKGVRGLSVETADRILHRLDLSVVDLIDADFLLPPPPRKVKPRAGIARGPGGTRPGAAAEDWEAGPGLNGENLAGNLEIP